MESEPLPRRMNVARTPSALRIGFVYSRVPFPMMRGDQLTVANLLSFLSARGHAVDFYSLDTGGAMTAGQARWLEESCRTVKLYPHGAIDIALGIAAALLRGLPVQIGYFRNRALTADVRRAVAAGRYDILYVYYLRSAEVVPPAFAPGRTADFAGTRTAAFLAMQLSQTLNTRRIFENQTNAIKRAFYWLEQRLLRRYEARVWRRFTKCVLIGPADVAAIEDACRAEGQPEINNWVYGAHGTDTDKFRAALPSDVVPGRIVFSGSMFYEPNVQAIGWFVERCWPAIRARHPAATLFIVGRDPAPEVRALGGRDGIGVTGTVPDVGEYVRSAAVCINPMIAAGGMQNKLIEYMACAKAVVATPVANEGIGAPDGTLFICADAAAFTEGVCALLEDPERAAALGRAAREYVLRAWTWESHFEALEREFVNALAAG